MDDLHSKPGDHAFDGAPDAPVSDEAEGASGNVPVHAVWEFPVAGAHGAVVVRDAADDGEEQGNGVFGHAFGD